MADLADKPFVVDLVIAVCNGCHGERNYPIDPPFRTADAFIAWQKSGVVTPCSCGYPTADLKLRIADQN
jgi:hypothetical protein